jgi:YVTN family beta-propeller protein
MQVYRLDWKSNQTLSRMSSDGAAGLQGIRYDRAKGRVLISNVSRSTNKVRLLSNENGTLKTVADALGSFTAGALAQNEEVAAVPLIYDNKLAIVNLSDGRIVSSLPTGIAPFGAAINKEGTVAYVSNWGGRVPGPKDLTAPTGLQPAADRVVIDAQGKAATGTVTRLDLASGKATHTIPVELHPTAILWDEARNRLYVANGNKDSVSVIDTVKNEAVKTIVLQPFEKVVRGIAPTALALPGDGSRLYVACGGINAVAVVDLASSKIAGLIPTAWYPNGLSLSLDDSHLAVSTLLGSGSGWQDAKQKRYVHAYRGSVAVIPIPDAGQLNSYTTAVAENNGWE